ncbi:hypothetical protein PVL29_000340 [Vitis rotundifolia]|uniref:non-specific serine/threonine protein kinase n=1 Tax=Vitis rotundifolia TaxID=103349 RepID=A0AA39E6Q9_VITRO|nr:hypothetical protein PVL29_000340 [Vitis rotundifolia]
MVHRLFMFFKASSPPFIISTIFALLLVIEKSLCVDPYFETCSLSRTCGGLKISFPFYIEGLQDPLCGYLGFNVSCLHNTTILTISENPYIIHEIFYQNQTLRVSNALGNGCLPLGHDLLLPNEQLELAHPDGTDFFFFLSNCSAPLPDNLVRYKINCSGDDGESPVLVMSKGDSNWVLASEKCGREVKAPFEEKADDGSNEIGEELVRRGFMLKWRASDCSMCEESGGKCGFNITDYHFKCFCSDRAHATNCVSRNDKLMKLELGLAVGIGVLLAVVFFFCFWRNCKSIKRTKNHPNIEAFLRNHGSLALKRYRHSDVKKMTNSFKDKIGEGGYGDVYKGKLLDGQMVAVKVLNETKGNGEEFINEVASISRTSHINIVSLLGFCFEGPKRALIYEFMPNGSLEKYICNGNHSKTNCQLGWETLYKIAVGIARGLEYLHRGCNTRILHFDIKPHNILLSEDFCPKISDFGLAKLCTRKDSIISMLGTRGTPGYIAPEVFSRAFGGVSHKSDVYSYGMMVLDMVGGRKDIVGGSSHTSEIYFPDSIYKCIEEDEDLGLPEIMNGERECTRKMIIVSLWCIQTRPSDRPPMCQVLEMLGGSLQSLQIPPKPYLFSPPRSLQDSSTTTVS